MAAWFDLVFFNVAGAACLALLAWSVSRHLHRPALAHTLWLLVLLKLIAPPLVEVAGLPHIASRLASSRASNPLAIETRRPPSIQEDPLPRSATQVVPRAAFPDPVAWDVSTSRTIPDRWRAVWGAGRILPWVLFAGTAWILGLTGIRVWRFRRHLGQAVEAPDELRARALLLAQQLGIPRPPRIRLVGATISPSLWPRLWSCEILLPARLLSQLTPVERDMLLAHELAHVKRRDHWIRPIEQLVVALHWWNPLAWWARGQLRAEEEKACDALVLQKVPSQARVYAEGLLKSIEFLALKPRLDPVLATGAGNVMQLEERMKSILSARTRARDPRWLRSLVVFPAALLLIVAPVWVGNSAGIDEPTPEARESESTEFHREELRLQKELRDIETRHMQVHLQIEALVLERERSRMRQEIERLEKEGRTEEAAELRQQIAKTEREADLNRRAAQLDLELSQKRQALEFEQQEISLQYEELMRRGDEVKAAALLEQGRQIDLQLKRMQLDALRAELEHRRELLGLSKEELEELSKP